MTDPQYIGSENHRAESSPPAFFPRDARGSLKIRRGIEGDGGLVKTPGFNLGEI